MSGRLLQEFIVFSTEQGPSFQVAEIKAIIILEKKMAHLTDLEKGRPTPNLKLNVKIN